MSAESRPITPIRFAAALKDLSVEGLYAKVAEIWNSIHHLIRSNSELLEYANEGDKEFTEAIQENETVIQSMEDRVALIRVEIENRGMKWIDPLEAKTDEDTAQDSNTGQQQQSTRASSNDGGISQGARELSLGDGRSTNNTQSSRDGTTEEEGVYL